MTSHANQSLNRSLGCFSYRLHRLAQRKFASSHPLNPSRLENELVFINTLDKSTHLRFVIVIDLIVIIMNNSVLASPKKRDGGLICISLKYPWN